MFLSLTLVGLGVSSDQVLEFEAVGSHLLLRLTADSRHVAVLHLTGAAAGPRVDTHSERLIWKTEGREIASGRSTDIFIHREVKSHPTQNSELKSGFKGSKSSVPRGCFKIHENPFISTQSN